MTDREDERLRALFRRAHERLDPPPPPFGGLIRTAGPATTLPRRRSLVAIVAAAGVAVAAGTLWMMVQRGGSTIGEGEAFRLAAELGDWEAPTDFLLQTPGIEFLREAPRFGTSLDRYSDETAPPIPKETL